MSLDHPPFCAFLGVHFSLRTMQLIFQNYILTTQVEINLTQRPHSHAFAQ